MAAVDSAYEDKNGKLRIKDHFEAQTEKIKSKIAYSDMLIMRVIKRAL